MIGLASIGLIILGFLLVAGLFSLLIRATTAAVAGYGRLIRQYPRFMRILHLALAMGLAILLAHLAGLGPEAQIAIAALIPALWGWLWLTRRLPLVLMPINAALLGAGLYHLAQISAPSWQPTWESLTAGLPVIGNLPLILAGLPMALWLWSLEKARWPLAFQAIGKLILGGLLAFVLLRAWTGCSSTPSSRGSSFCPERKVWRGTRITPFISGAS